MVMGHTNSATALVRTITHPSTNQACAYLTLVINHKMLAPTYQGSISDQFQTFLRGLNTEHRTRILIILPSPGQWTGESIHQIYKINTKNALILNLTHI